MTILFQWYYNCIDFILVLFLPASGDRDDKSVLQWFEHQIQIFLCAMFVFEYISFKLLVMHLLPPCSPPPTPSLTRCRVFVIIWSRFAIGSRLRGRAFVVVWRRFCCCRSSFPAGALSCAHFDASYRCAVLSCVTFFVCVTLCLLLPSCCLANNNCYTSAVLSLSASLWIGNRKSCCLLSCCCTNVLLYQKCISLSYKLSLQCMTGHTRMRIIIRSQTLYNLVCFATAHSRHLFCVGAISIRLFGAFSCCFACFCSA